MLCFPLLCQQTKLSGLVFCAESVGICVYITQHKRNKKSDGSGLLKNVEVILDLKYIWLILFYWAQTSLAEKDPLFRTRPLPPPPSTAKGNQTQTHSEAGIDGHRLEGHQWSKSLLSTKKKCQLKENIVMNQKTLISGIFTDWGQMSQCLPHPSFEMPMNNQGHKSIILERKTLYVF